jgi:alpha-mannosidase
MRILDVETTKMFIGTGAAPRQAIRIRVTGDEGGDGGPARLRVIGDRVRSEADVTLGPLGPGEEARLEVGVAVDGSPAAGKRLAAELVVDASEGSARHPFEFVVAEPGWRMFMIAHFHYDPVWWNTQAAYTESWGSAIQFRSPFQEPGLALVKAHLDMARRDADYKFVLAELDYLKPYWDIYPEDRAWMRQLLADGRIELMGGTYNEPNTNLTSAESTIRNAIYGIAYQRDVLGGAPATAWQLDAFGHDPQFPGIMADAGVTSSSWARGPFHEWGPHWVRGPARMSIAELARGGAPEMQFATEFDWIAPSGRALLTSFQANHYSAGWWMDSATTLELAEAEVYRHFTELAPLAATKNVLLPVGTDYSPPNRWLTAIARDWNARYVWPKFLVAIPREFFDAVREERAATGRGFSPQTRDMNPVYTGKDVSFIDTKQAQRVAENTLLSAEKFATVAATLGGRYPSEAIDKAWRQLLFGAHHDGITGSESDQVYLDLLAGWREAQELGATVLDSALALIASAIDTAGEGAPIVVYNPQSWPRTDIARVRIEVAADDRGVSVRDGSGASVPFLLEAAERRGGGTIATATLAFLASEVPPIGYRTYRVVPIATPLDDSGWRATDGTSIAGDRFAVGVDPERGGAIVSIVDRASRKELVRDGEVANELRVYREYPNHPLFAEGPWHLTPDGRFSSSAEGPADVRVEDSPIGRRIVVDGTIEGCRRRQEIVLWDGVDRVEMRTTLDDYTGQDRLFRVRFPTDVRGGRPVSEVGNAVVARPFGTPNVDVAEVPFTLDNPAYNWFALGSTARVDVFDPHGDDGRSDRIPWTSRALGVAEIIVPDDPGLDDVVRRLVVSLVRQGVTSTVTLDHGSRYGVLQIDSNLPDVRVAIGGPDRNQLVRDALDAAEPERRRELRRQLVDQGWARVWIPSDESDTVDVAGFPDVRDIRALPLLIVAGNDAAETRAAVDALIADVEDGTVRVVQAPHPDERRETLEDHTVGLLNRGLPGFSVESSGDLYLSLMRSCSGWPSGVWIDPPRRSVPDGSNFQFQHWSHTFDYALVSTSGDWRAGDLVRSGHDYNNPLPARVEGVHDGSLPAAASFVAVRPSSAVVTSMKPTGNPMARLAEPSVDPADGIVLRVHESTGRISAATVSTRWPLSDATRTNATEESSSPLSTTDHDVAVSLDPFEIATVRVRPRATAADVASGTAGPLGPRSEAAQPVYSRYWMHNKGAAPLGYQPVSVQIRPPFARGAGPFRVEAIVASSRPDTPIPGTLTIAPPPGWTASPPGRLYTLAPGAHLRLESMLTPANDAQPGKYFAAARIEDEAGQVFEDILTIDYDPALGGSDGSAGPAAAAEMPLLGEAMARALRRVEPGAAVGDGANAGRTRAEPSRELEVTMLTRAVDLAARERDAIRVRLRNLTLGEIRGEAQIISPHETWPSITPWTQGFAVGPGEESTLAFGVAPGYDHPGGTYWALVKVMFFGRLQYTEAIPVRVERANGFDASRVATPVGGQART